MRAAVVALSQGAGAKNCSGGHGKHVKGAGRVQVACASAGVLVNRLEFADVSATDILAMQAGVVAGSASTCF